MVGFYKPCGMCRLVEVSIDFCVDIFRFGGGHDLDPNLPKMDTGFGSGIEGRNPGI